MNNKNIAIYSIAAVILIIGGIFIFKSMESSNSEPSAQISSTQDVQKDRVENKQTENQVAGTETKPEEEKIAGTTPVTSPTCERKFDENKLKTAKVSITNQFVELDVKAFGKIRVQLYDKDAPKTVENFLRLVNSGYYDCLTFHRIAKGFVIQGGDPNGNGTGGVSAFGPKFEDELNPQTPSYNEGYKHGVLAMANSGKNTNGSQFFIMLSDYPLDHAYTIFGKVTEGLENVDKIGGVEITGGRDGTPKEKIIINKATIVTK